MVFVDSAAWISLLVEVDDHHPPMVGQWRELLGAGAGFVTSSDVCSETITYLRYKIGYRSAVSFHESIQAAQAKGRLLIEWVTPSIFDEAWKLFRQYDDRKLSMVDCTSFVICRKRRIETVLTLDKHFLIAGFDVIPRDQVR